jgi:hypothetical protein
MPRASNGLEHWDRRDRARGLKRPWRLQSPAASPRTQDHREPVVRMQRRPPSTSGHSLGCDWIGPRRAREAPQRVCRDGEGKGRRSTLASGQIGAGAAGRSSPTSVYKISMTSTHARVVGREEQHHCGNVLGLDSLLEALLA